MIKRLTHARYAPQFALLDWFRPLRRGPRPPVAIEEQVKGGWVRIDCPRALGIDDQSALFAVLAAAGPYGIGLEPEPSADKHVSYALRQHLTAGDKDRPTLTVTTTLPDLCRIVGVTPSGGGRAAVQASLDRLAAVTLICHVDGWHWQSRVLGSVTDPGKGVRVAIASRLADAIGGRHVRIDLDERRRLQSDPAKAAHARLSAWLSPGRRNLIGIDTLAGHVWPGAAASDSAARKRRQRIREALGSIDRLSGWTISERMDGVAEVQRAARPNPQLRSQTPQLQSQSPQLQSHSVSA